MSADNNNDGFGAFNELNEDEQFLNSGLVRYFRSWPASENEEINCIEITVFSTLVQLADKIGSKDKFDQEYIKRKKVAPFWPRALKLWIEEIENDFLGYKEESATDYNGLSGGGRRLTRPALARAYSAIEAGKDQDLREYTELLVHFKNPQDRWFNNRALTEIGLGVALAYGLRRLKDELDDLNAEEETGKGPGIRIAQKLQWTGTPSEFGRYILQLKGNGYLTLPYKSHKKNAEYLLTIWDVRNDRGEPTTEATLAKEINPQSNSLSPDKDNLWKRDRTK